jgi:hypothetical protein
MQISVSGSRGLVGSALLPALQEAGHQVIPLVRGIPEDGEIGWDLEHGEIEDEKFEGLDAVVHLAGESIAEGRWTEAKKARIRESRVAGTQLVSEALAGLERKPSVFVCASAIGYYGDRPDEVCDEASEPGQGFLPDVSAAWEAATKPAADAGIRVVNLRIGVVLSTQGGALAKMLLPFKLGLGGSIGSGKQYWSWISIDDLVRTIVFAIDKDSISGPVNVVVPSAVTNREFTKTLGRVLRRPTFFPMPAFAARLAFGEMANDLLLADNHIEPRLLQLKGFQFEHPDLESALRHLLKR